MKVQMFPQAPSPAWCERKAPPPLPNITVALNNVEVTTDTNGRFVFREVPVGFVTIEVSTTGFIAYMKQIEVLAGDNSLDISLVRRFDLGSCSEIVQGRRLSAWTFPS